MRFVGQAFEVPVELEPTRLGGLTRADLAERFAAAHHRVYRHGGDAARAVEIVGLRFGIRRPLEGVPGFVERPMPPLVRDSTSVRVGARTLAARLLPVAALPPEPGIAGPALLESYSSTIWVPPEWQAVRDAVGNVLLRRQSA
jgi:N-methylhydantoinase A